MSDCAAEYNTPELKKVLKEHGVIEFRHSNEDGQAANGMVGKFGDTLGRGLRAPLLQSGMPFPFWGAAVILVTDIYNSCPHEGLRETLHTTGEQENTPTCRFSPIRMCNGGIPWQRFGGAPQASAAGRKGRVFRHRQAVWPASIHVLLRATESSICQCGLRI